MDAVELSIPAAVSFLDVLADGGFGRSGVTEREAESWEHVSISESRSVAGGNSSISGTVTVAKQNLVSGDKKVDIGTSMHGSRLSSFVGENIDEQHSFNGANNSPLLPKCGGKQLQRKAGKFSSSSSPCSKRIRTEQVEDSMNQVADDSNIISGKVGSSPTKCMFAVKSRVFKQKHSLDAKRGDKRNFKAPTKVKTHSFFSKAGLMNTNSASGENNILGIYGLKSDIHDVTKLVDELSLNELLDGSYKCPNLCQDKGKKAVNANESILQSVRKACSILQLQTPVLSQNAAEVDNSNRKTSACPLSSVLCGTSSMECDKDVNYMTDLASPEKDLFVKPGVPTHMIDPTLYQPNDILERLALPSAKDLDSLLLDTAKSAILSKSTDLCSSKPTFYKASLPPFPWSYSFGGSSKTNVDLGKLSASRSTCQGRWVRIGSISSSTGDNPSSFSDLDSLIYDHSLVPSEGLKPGLSRNEVVPSTPFRFLQSNQASSSIVTSLLASHGPCEGSSVKTSQDPLEGNMLHRCLDLSNAHLKLEGISKTGQIEGRDHDGRTDNGVYSPFKCSVGGCNQLIWHLHTPEKSKQDGHSPRLWAAAETLFEISNHFRNQNQNSENIRWLKKSSQKAMKARKSRSSTGKAEGMPPVIPKSETEPDLAKNLNHIMPTKKPKFSLNNNKKDLQNINNLGSGLIKCPTSTPSKSPQRKLEGGSVPESEADILKLMRMMPPPPPPIRVLDKACNSHSKPRKMVTMDWGKGRSKKE